MEGETEFKRELCNALAQEIARGSISRIPDQSAIDRIRALFPMSRISGIDWERVPQVQFGGYSTAASESDRVVAARATLDQFQHYASLDDTSSVQVFGDADTTMMFVMPFRLLREYIGLFIILPMGTYVLAQHVDWCLYFGMAGGASFGPAPRSRRRKGEEEKGA